MKTILFILFLVGGKVITVSIGNAQSLGEVRKFDLGDDLTIDMIWVNPGEYLMGSPTSEPERNALNEQQHNVTLSKGFWIAKTEVTQQQWEAVMGNNPSKIIAANHPVEQVSWNEALKFISKINTNGASFRLPYEAEWEYACRAGTSTAHAGVRDQMTWHFGNSGRSTHPVGTKIPNAWGLHDMHGNVSEMCMDWYKDDISNDNLDPKGPASGTRKVERGGQYTGRIRHTRSADRSSGEPAKNAFFVGFRLVHD
ncbi:MAG: formylglycine-generating enzyme family protein [Reichenbachiella sp.]|uniref:formylglycine-generating enzyme family protein n=1 Tax=Reichenbachiella sp. TaxID=2184521 RepID=UPI003267C114